MGSPDTARLTPEQSQTIFHEEVLPAFRNAELGKPIPKSPEAIVLGGQPGSGKTGMLGSSAAELKTKGATWTINGNDFYAFHPSYRELHKKHGPDAAHMVKDEANFWVAQTIKAAQERGVNIVLESTMRKSEHLKTTLEELQKSGYIIHAKILAVKEQTSWQGNHMRHEASSLNGAYSRLTSRETHDDGARGVIKTLAMIEQKKLVDRISVHQRNGKTVYDTQELHHEKLNTRTPAAEAVLKTRQRPLSATEAAQHAKNWQSIETLAAKRHDRENTTPKRVGAEMAAIRTQRNVDLIDLAVSKAPARTSSSQNKEKER